MFLMAAPMERELVLLGMAFYDVQRHYGASERYARDQAVRYMRRKAEDCGDAMPFYEALADALAARASGNIDAAQLAVVQTP
jgi:hypothetical protein